MKIKRKINSKFLIAIFLIILIILFFIYGTIISRKLKIKKFEKENVRAYEKNQEQVFKVKKIIICSSANALDLSEKQNLQDLSIYQYTDIAVYIDNGEELSNKNTIKSLYIDNISLEGTSNIGKRSLNYKNINKFGLKLSNPIKNLSESDITQQNSTSNVFESLMNQQENNENENIEDNTTNLVTNENNEKIDFNIIYTNEENEKANYDDPTFYTDCSNPITLEYLNTDIITHYKMDENKSVSFDGSILKEAGISTDNIACKVKFKINIVNNMDEKYNCWVSFQIPLDDIYEGTTMKGKDTNSNKYIFYRE